MLSPLITKKFTALISSMLKVEKTTIVVPPSNNDLYVERGSPYNNRTIGSESAEIIFYEPRDKKQIALTDAETTVFSTSPKDVTHLMM